MKDILCYQPRFSKGACQQSGFCCLFSRRGEKRLSYGRLTLLWAYCAGVWCADFGRMRNIYQGDWVKWANSTGKWLIFLKPEYYVMFCCCRFCFIFVYLNDGVILLVVWVCLLLNSLSSFVCCFFFFGLKAIQQWWRNLMSNSLYGREGFPSFSLCWYIWCLNLMWQWLIWFQIKLTTWLYANSCFIPPASFTQSFSNISRSCQPCVPTLIKYSDLTFFCCVFGTFSAVQRSWTTNTYHPCLCLLLWFKLGLNEKMDCATIIIQGWLGALI